MVLNSANLDWTRYMVNASPVISLLQSLLYTRLLQAVPQLQLDCPDAGRRAPPLTVSNIPLLI